MILLLLRDINLTLRSITLMSDFIFKQNKSHMITFPMKIKNYLYHEMTSLHFGFYFDGVTKFHWNSYNLE